MSGIIGHSSNLVLTSIVLTPRADSPGAIDLLPHACDSRPSFIICFGGVKTSSGFIAIYIVVRFMGLVVGVLVCALRLTWRNKKQRTPREIHGGVRDITRPVIRK